jgi:hypothetical protein
VAATIIETAKAEGEQIIDMAMARRQKFDSDLALIKASLRERVTSAARSAA